MCDDGGTCQNVQWEGYTCDNQFSLNSANMKLYNSSQVQILPQSVKLDPDVTYRIDTLGKKKVYLSRYTEKKIVKLFIDFVCKDRTLKFKKDKKKNCAWVGSEPSRKKRLCKQSTVVIGKCPKTW